MQTLVAVFNDIKKANSTIDALVAAGIARNRISIVNDSAKTTTSASATQENSGGFMGMLRGLFGDADPVEVDAYHNDVYTEGIRRGRVVLTVQGENAQIDQIHDIIEKYDPVDINEDEAAWRAEGWNGATTTTAHADMNAAATKITTSVTPTASVSSQKTPVANNTTAKAVETDGKTVLQGVEERIDVQKRAVEKGRVRVFTTVSERPVQADVTLREEKVTVDRRPVDRPLTAGDNPFQEKTIEMTERGEQAVINKTARVVEEVVVGKEATERTEKVTDTVRKTEIHVEKDAAAASTGVARAYADFDKDFQTDFGTRYAGKNYQYTTYEPVYRYGYTLATNDAYKGMDWDRVEAQARTSWQKDHPNQQWQDVKDSIRHAWDKVRAGR